MQLKDLEKYIACQEEGIVTRRMALAKQKKKVEARERKNTRVYAQKFEEQAPTYDTSALSCQTSPFKGKLCG